jgi:hypothetical protein
VRTLTPATFPNPPATAQPIAPGPPIEPASYCR